VDRFGAVLAMITGAGLSAVGAVLWFDGYIWYIAFLGPFILLAGSWGYWHAAARARQAKPKLSAEQLRAMVEDRPLSFAVCTRCRTLANEDWGDGCPNCGARAGFLAVADEDDRRMALSSIT
jgi:hypothetical protein